MAFERTGMGGERNPETGTVRGSIRGVRVVRGRVVRGQPHTTLYVPIFSESPHSAHRSPTTMLIPSDQYTPQCASPQQHILDTLVEEYPIRRHADPMTDRGPTSAHDVSSTLLKSTAPSPPAIAPPRQTVNVVSSSPLRLRHVSAPTIRVARVSVSHAMTRPHNHAMLDR